MTYSEVRRDIERMLTDKGRAHWTLTPKHQWIYAVQYGELTAEDVAATINGDAERKSSNVDK